MMLKMEPQSSLKKPIPGQINKASLDGKNEKKKKNYCMIEIGVSFPQLVITCLTGDPKEKGDGIPAKGKGKNEKKSSKFSMKTKPITQRPLISTGSSYLAFLHMDTHHLSHANHDVFKWNI